MESTCNSTCNKKKKFYPLGKVLGPKLKNLN